MTRISVAFNTRIRTIMDAWMARTKWALMVGYADLCSPLEREIIYEHVTSITEHDGATGPGPRLLKTLRQLARLSTRAKMPMVEQLRTLITGAPPDVLAALRTMNGKLTRPTAAIPFHHEIGRITTSVRAQRIISAYMTTGDPHGTVYMTPLLANNVPGNGNRAAMEQLMTGHVGAMAEQTEMVMPRLTLWPRTTTMDGPGHKFAARIDGMTARCARMVALS